MSWFEVTGELDPMQVIAGSFEHGTSSVLIDRDVLPAAFFDLSSGVAGELVQKLVNYGLRAAFVVPEPASHSASFQDFAREANRGTQFHFAATRAAAIDWLGASE
jgi:hypothetical protein